METLPRFCRFCNLVFALAEKRVLVGQSAFHEDCFVKHLRKVNGNGHDHKPPVVKRKPWAWPARVH